MLCSKSPPCAKFRESVTFDASGSTGPLGSAEASLLNRHCQWLKLLQKELQAEINSLEALGLTSKDAVDASACSSPTPRDNLLRDGAHWNPKPWPTGPPNPAGAALAASLAQSSDEPKFESKRQASGSLENRDKVPLKILASENIAGSQELLNKCDWPSQQSVGVEDSMAKCVSRLTVMQSIGVQVEMVDAVQWLDLEDVPEKAPEASGTFDKPPELPDYHSSKSTPPILCTSSSRAFDLLQELEEKEKELQDIAPHAVTYEYSVWKWIPFPPKPQPTTLINRIVLSYWFDMVCTFVICVNCVFIGYALDYKASYGSESSPRFGELCERLFWGFYLIELIAKVFVQRLYFLVGHEYRWNLFDVALVTTSAYDQLSTLLHYNSSAGDVLFVRVLRIVRLAKILRMVRVLKFFRELRHMLFSIAGAMRSLFWCFVMIALIIYVFALIFLQASVHLMQDVLVSQSAKRGFEDYWSGVGISMDSLFKALTSGDDWSRFGDPFQESSPVYYIVFLFYIGFTFFAVMNILTGIFVDNAIKLSSSDRDQVILENLEQEESFAHEIKMLFHKIDANGSGTVSWEELEPQLRDPAVQSYLASLELTIQDAGLFFRMLSEHSSQANKEVDIDTFVDGCMRVKGPAMGLDLQAVNFSIRQIQEQQQISQELNQAFFTTCANEFKRLSGFFAAIKRKPRADELE